jgi:hypothetical protein
MCLNLFKHPVPFNGYFVLYTLFITYLGSNGSMFVHDKLKMRGKKLPWRLKTTHENRCLCETSHPVQRSLQAETEIRNFRFADADLTYLISIRRIHLYSFVLLPYTCNMKTQVIYIRNTYGYVKAFVGTFITLSQSARLPEPNISAI